MKASSWGEVACNPSFNNRAFDISAISAKEAVIRLLFITAVLAPVHAIFYCAASTFCSVCRLISLDKNSDGFDFAKYTASKLDGTASLIYSYALLVINPSQAAKLRRVKQFEFRASREFLHLELTSTSGKGSGGIICKWTHNRFISCFGEGASIKTRNNKENVFVQIGMLFHNHFLVRIHTLAYYISKIFAKVLDAIIGVFLATASIVLLGRIDSLNSLAFDQLKGFGLFRDVFAMLQHILWINYPLKQQVFL